MYVANSGAHQKLMLTPGEQEPMAEGCAINSYSYDEFRQCVKETYDGGNY